MTKTCTDNFICGKKLNDDKITHSRKHLANNNVALFGAPGTNKTQTLLYNLKSGVYESAVVVDPKGQLYDENASELRSMGYNVELLDISGNNSEHSVLFNPLRHVAQGEEGKLAEIMFDGASHGKVGDEPYWAMMTKKTLRGAIGYVLDASCSKSFSDVAAVIRGIHTSEGYNKRTFTPMGAKFPVNTDRIKGYNAIRERHSRIFDEDDIEDDDYEFLYEDKSLEEYLEQVIKDDPDASWADVLMDVAKIGSHITRTCVIAEALATLEPFLDDRIRNMSGKRELNVEQLATENTILFISVSDCDRSFDVVANIAISQIVNELYAIASRTPGHCLKKSVAFLLDDLCTNFKIENLPQYLSSSRSRDISFTIVCQSYNQLRNLYHEDAETILADCTTQLFLGANDFATSDYFAKKFNLPIHRVVSMKKGDIWIYHSGDRPVFAKSITYNDNVLLAEREQYKGFSTAI